MTEVNELELGEISWGSGGELISGMGYTNDITLKENLDSKLALHATKTLLSYENKQWTFEEMNRQSNDIACLMQHKFNIAPGANVAICTKNFPELAMIFLATIKVGAVANILSPENSNAKVIAAKIQSQRASLFFCDGPTHKTMMGQLRMLGAQVGTETVLIRHSLARMISRLPKTFDLETEVANNQNKVLNAVDITPKDAAVVFFNETTANSFSQRALLTGARNFMNKNLGEERIVYCAFPLFETQGLIHGFLGCILSGFTFHMDLFRTIEFMVKEIARVGTTDIICSTQYALDLLKPLGSQHKLRSMEIIDDERIINASGGDVIAALAEKKFKVNLEFSLSNEELAGPYSSCSADQFAANNCFVGTTAPCVETLTDEAGKLAFKTPLKKLKDLKL